MQKYKITLAYDGTRYGGWQVQPNSLGVQDVLQNAFKKVLQETVLVTGSGRTDAGVHALNQTGHFTFDKPINAESFPYVLNSVLPDDIYVKRIDPVPEDFHARYSATGKKYIYELSYGANFDPFTRLYTWHVPYRNFSLELLKEGARELVGTHDFKGFANEAHRGPASYDSIRTLSLVDVQENEGKVTITFKGDGFLYKMVRNCVGTLVDIARGYFPPSVVPKILEMRDRKLAGASAPPHGLFLADVYYGSSFSPLSHRDQ